VDAASAVMRLRRSLRIEIAGVVAVLGATALLVGLQPAAEAAGISGAYSTYVPLGEEYEVNVTVDPNRVGRNEIHLYVLGADGRQVDLASDVVLGLSQPERDIGPLRRETTRLGPGHFFLSGPELSVPGRWEIEIEVPVSRFDVLSSTVPVTVNPD
jgi:copper transport protein